MRKIYGPLAETAEYGLDRWGGALYKRSLCQA